MQLGVYLCLSYLWLCVLQWKTQAVCLLGDALTWHSNTGGVVGLTVYSVVQDIIRSSKYWYINIHEGAVAVFHFHGEFYVLVCDI